MKECLFDIIGWNILYVCCWLVGLCFLLIFSLGVLPIIKIKALKFVTIMANLSPLNLSVFASHILEFSILVQVDL